VHADKRSGALGSVGSYVEGFVSGIGASPIPG
jgi:hypothetical protein